jgi:hypothetical protein
MVVYIILEVLLFVEIISAYPAMGLITVINATPIFTDNKEVGVKNATVWLAFQTNGA